MLRNILFSIFFFSGIILISILFLPALLLPQRVVLFGGKLMGFWTGICLKIFMSTKIKILGKENIIRDKNFFIAERILAKHDEKYMPPEIKKILENNVK